jgi:nitrite reductase/ring-hydroxylating ferredoxin subunit
MKTFQNDDENTDNYSSNIALIDYEEDASYPLIVCFHHGGTYRYKTGMIYDDQERKFLFELGLERKPYELLEEADSVGKAFHQLIRDKCDYTKA